MNNHQYSELSTTYLEFQDLIRLAHVAGGPTMAAVDQAGEKPSQPIAMRTRSRVALSKRHIALRKSISKLRDLQEAARAKRIQRDADVAAGRPVSPIPHGYVTAADLKKMASDKRKRKSWQRWDLACRLRSNPLHECYYSDSSSDCSERYI
jgi:hypothetical protein